MRLLLSVILYFLIGIGTAAVAVQERVPGLAGVVLKPLAFDALGALVERHTGISV